MTQPRTLLRLAVAIVLSIATAAALAGCDYDNGDQNTNVNTNTNRNTNTNVNVNTTVDPTCNDVRITRYTASARGWCGFNRDLSILPDFVQQGLTFAMAEPWNGGSYGGAPGEGCGECWEVSSSWATVIVMMHDLCPIEGNPVCAGEMLHFDLASEADAALQMDGTGGIAARPVPCPVTGNIHVQISDWNQWGYQQLQFVNHRIPIRYASVRASPDGTWIPLERTGGRWRVMEGPEPGDGDGILYRVESAQGQVVEGTNVLPFTTVDPSGDTLLHDIGAQLDDLDPPEGVCEYTPPGRVYGDGYGGIPGVKWMPNPWGDTEVSEVTEGCHNDSASCIRLDHMGLGQGVHFYIWQAFPTDSFATLTVWARTLDGTSDLSLGPSNDGTICGEKQVVVTPEWAPITFDLATACPDTPVLSSVTLHHGNGEPMLLDDILFE